MFIVRPIKLEDSAKMQRLVADVGSGMDNLPKNSSEIDQAISSTAESLKQKSFKPNSEKYYFALERCEDKELLGLCGIFSSLPKENLHHFYRLEVEDGRELLRITEAPNDISEICALYISAKGRHSGLGKLLSLSRFLFMASFKERFFAQTMAEMRGYANEKSHMPFWEEVASHFVTCCSYENIVPYLRKNPEAIFDMVPKYPLYRCLLSSSAQEVIGKVHMHAAAAYNMLVNEGFVFDGEISLFDAGPNVIAQTDSIRTIRESKIVKIAKITASNLEAIPSHLISNNSLEFRCCYGLVEDIGSEVAISKAVAKMLDVDVGCKLRIAALPLK